MFAVSVVMAVFSALVTFGVTLPINVSPAQGALLLFSSTIVAVFSLLLATVHYKVTDTHLKLNLAFFDILGGRIRIENILNIVLKTDDTAKKPQRKMYISYIWKGEDPVIAQIAISPKKFESMKELLTSKNPNIVFWDDDKQGKTDE